ncbi:MAG TPA: hypothetical protein VLE53_13540 [Gemmatimonadaceae bacterium]|nr:hypothetical protein [Gemmatimonadaceae bacterium]
MNVREWLSARVPAQPPALSRRIGELVGPFEAHPGDRADQCLAAAAAGLQRLLDEPESSRAGALDLLAVDALVTYAFEAASEDPGRIPGLASHALHQLSALATRS